MLFEGKIMGYASNLKDKEWQRIEQHFLPKDR
jgi:hypothetical protein